MGDRGSCAAGGGIAGLCADGGSCEAGDCIAGEKCAGGSASWGMRGASEDA